MNDKILLIGLIILSVAYIAYAESTDNNELADIYYKSGLALTKQNKYNEAAEKFTKALSYRKDFPPAFFQLAECFEKTGAARQAVNNYRFCLKSLSENPARTKEENELLSSVSRTLERIDLNGAQFIRIKNSHISGLLALTNECLNKKYQRFALNLAESILRIDPANKPAQDLSAKIDQSIVDTQQENERKKTALTASQNLFNGKDISNWETGTPEYWRVTQRQLVAQPETSKTASIKWKGKPPEKFSLTLKFFIYAKNPKSLNVDLSFIKGVSNLGKIQLDDVFTIPKTMLRPGSNSIKLTRDKNFCNFKINGKTRNEGIMQIGGAPPTPCIGLTVRNGQVQFESIVLGP